MNAPPESIERRLSLRLLRPAWLAIPLACVGCGSGDTMCEGECPLPRVGAEVNTVDITRSTWADIGRLLYTEHLQGIYGVQESDPNLQTLLVDGRAGDFVFHLEGGNIRTSVFIDYGLDPETGSPTCYIDSYLIDVDQDGLIDGTLAVLRRDGSSTYEFPDGEVVCPVAQYFDTAGSLLFSVDSCGGHTDHLNRAHIRDLDGDGTLEFFVSSCSEGLIVNADGTERLRIDEGPVDLAVLSDGSIVLVSWEGRLSIGEIPAQETSQLPAWNLNGEPIAGISPDHLGLMMNDGCGRERRVNECEGVATLTYGHHDFTAPPLSSNNAVRVEISTSRLYGPGFQQILPPGGMWRPLWASRTIVRLYDPDGTLIYHEVVDNPSGSIAGQVLIVPSDVPGQDTLLVVNGDEILSYRLPAESQLDFVIATRDECSTQAECDDGRWCDGLETCQDGMCVAGSAPCADSALCNEEEERCNTFVLLSTSEANDAPASVINVNTSNHLRTTLSTLRGCDMQSSIDVEPASGLLYGVDPLTAPGEIVRMETEYGACDVVATLEAEDGPIQIQAVAFSADGTLYGATRPYDGHPAPVFGEIDLVTDTFAPLAQIDLEDYALIAGMDFSPSDVLYAVAHPVDGELALITVDLVSGEITSVPVVGGLLVDDIDYASDGLIYCTYYGFSLIRIDPADPFQEPIGFIVSNAFGGIASRDY